MKVFGPKMKVVLTNVRVFIKVEKIFINEVSFLINGEPFDLQLDEVIQIQTGASTKMWVESIYPYKVKLKFFTDFGEESTSELKARETITLKINLFDPHDPKGPDSCPRISRLNASPSPK